MTPPVSHLTSSTNHRDRRVILPPSNQFYHLITDHHHQSPHLLNCWLLQLCSAWNFSQHSRTGGGGCSRRPSDWLVMIYVFWAFIVSFAACLVNCSGAAAIINNLIITSSSPLQMSLIEKQNFINWRDWRLVLPGDITWEEIHYRANRRYFTFDGWASNNPSHFTEARHEIAAV